MRHRKAGRQLRRTSEQKLALMRSLAKSLIERLQKQYPGRFAEGQLRTLQRRIREWRGAMARTLVHACLDGKQATGNPVVVGTQTKG